MAKTIIRGQVARMGELQVREIKGQDTPVLYFTVADRSRKPAGKNAAGETQYVTRGFYFCKAYGKKAELIARDFGKKDENGKLISRAIYLETVPEPYRAKRVVEVEMPVAAKLVFGAFNAPLPEGVTPDQQIMFKKSTTIEEDKMAFSVREFEYDDWKNSDPLDEVSITVIGLDEVMPDDADVDELNEMDQQTA